MKGAPIRFVAAVVGGWVCIRVAILAPGADPLALAGDVLASSAAASARAESHARLPPRGGSAIGAKTMRVAHQPSADLTTTNRSSAIAVSTVTPPTKSDQRVSSHREERPQPILIPPITGLPTGEPDSRWQASAWLLARGGANGTLTGGRLGASQGGVRVTYRIDPERRIALTARVAAPLSGRGTEAAVGIDWRPTPAPVHLVVEQRISGDGGRGGPTVMAIGGIAPTRLGAGFKLEAYAQGGAILRDSRLEGFGDGAIRVARPVLALGSAILDAGLGAWGAGQSGAVRADVGPTLGVALPVAGKRLRIALDWRRRVAGHARPGSGPALSIGSDF